MANDVTSRGSIPARAGEPALGFGILGLSPRVRGKPSSWAPLGLSPRVRGNLGVPRTGLPSPQDGSIPARAGEPLDIPRGQGLSPRGRGNSGRTPESRLSGLSPRVRGNLNPERLASAPRPSYPRAGEPPGHAADLGLSPRVRGKSRILRRALSPRRIRLYSLRWDRSIPARAGNPTTCSTAPSWGRSPRVRGNRLSRGAPCPHPMHGSIPARAGEPLHLPGARASA